MAGSKLYSNTWCLGRSSDPFAHCADNEGYTDGYFKISQTHISGIGIDEKGKYIRHYNNLPIYKLRLQKYICMYIQMAGNKSYQSLIYMYNEPVSHNIGCYVNCTQYI